MATMTMSMTDAIAAAEAALPDRPTRAHTYPAPHSTAERAIPLEQLSSAADMSAEMRNRHPNRTTVNNDDSSPERDPALTPDPSEDHEHGKGEANKA